MGLKKGAARRQGRAAEVLRTLFAPVVPRLQRSIFELSPLEARMYLSFAPEIKGPPSYSAGSDYTLNLTVAGTEASQTNKWSITWGDGSPAEVITGSGLSDITRTHTFSNPAQNYPITARAYTPSRTGGVLARGLGLDPLFGGGTGKVSKKLKDPGGNDQGYAMKVLSDGKILVAGQYNGIDFGLARFNADGTLDTNFAMGGPDGDGIASLDFSAGSDLANAIALQSDGSIVLAGTAYVSGVPRFALAHFSADGAFDSGFGKVTTSFPSASAQSANAVAVQSDGKIVVAGQETIAGREMFAVARYSSAGVLDNNFSGDGLQTVDFGSTITLAIARAAVIQVDGKIVLGGYICGSGTISQTDFALARLTTSGNLDGTFNSSGTVLTDFGCSGGCCGCSTSVYASDYSLVLQGDGKILAAGDVGGDFGLARYNTNGSLDTTGFGAGGKVQVDFNGGLDTGLAVALQADGKIVIAGGSDSGATIGTNTDFGLLRLNANGTPDSTFGSSGKINTDIDTNFDSARAVAVLPDGRILAAGYSYKSATGKYQFALARYQPRNTVAAVPAPTNLAITAQGPSSVSLSWTPVASSNKAVTGYQILRDGVVLATVAATQSSYADVTVVPQSAYAFTVRAVDYAGSWSASTAAVQVAAVPPVPSDLSAAATMVVSSVLLTWTDPSNGQYNFTIERATDTNGTWTSVWTGTGSQHTDTGVTPGVTYLYHLRASNSRGASNWSSPPATVTLRDVYLNNFGSPVAGEWSSNTRSSTPTGGRNYLGRFGNDTVSLTLSNLPAHSGLTVSFDLYVIGSWGGYGDANPGDDRWSLRVGGGAAPRTLLDTSFSNFPQDHAEAAQHQQNYPDAYHTTTNPPAFLASEINQLGYTGTFDNPSLGPVPADSVYHITRTFAHADGTLQLDFSGLGLGTLAEQSWGLDNVKVSMTSEGANDLTATATPAGPIDLRWINDARAQQGFWIYRSTDNISFELLKSVGAKVTQYRDQETQHGKTYYYKIAAYNGRQPGPQSNVASATAALANVSFSYVETVQLPVWAPDGQASPPILSTTTLLAGVHYQLRASGTMHLGGKLGRADSEYSYGDSLPGSAALDNSYATDVDYGIGVDDPVKDTNKYPHWSPTFNAEHDYVVDIVGKGAPISLDFHDDWYHDNTLDTTPFLQVQIFRADLAGPTDLVASPSSQPSPHIDLAWKDNSADETGFRVERSDDGVNFTTLDGSLPANTTTYTDTTALPSVKYYYRVFAFGISGDSQPSNIATAILDDAGASVSGHVFHDRNRNGIWDKDLIIGSQPDVILVLDISGSTIDRFTRTDEGDPTIGDLNGADGPDTRLDAEIAGLSALNAQLVKLGFGNKANVTVVAFNALETDNDGNTVPGREGVYVQDMNPSLAGQQVSTFPSADADLNGVPDVAQALRRLVSRGGTLFAPPLQKSIDIFRQLHTTPGNANLVFLSDGESQDSGFTSLVDTLKTEFNANIRAFGVGTDASREQLQEIDPRMSVFTRTDQLLGAFSGLSGDEPAEEAMQGWRVYLDLNGSGHFEQGEPSAITGADGAYTIAGLSAGTYNLAEEPPAGQENQWNQTAPVGGAFQLTLDSQGQATDRDFGNAEAAPPPQAVVSVAGPANEGSPVVVSVTSPQGQGPFRYSYDLDGDGQYEVYRSVSPQASITLDDGPAERDGTVIIYDAVGQSSVYTVHFVVNNVAPRARIVGAPATVELSRAHVVLSADVRDVSQKDQQSDFTYLWKVVKDGQIIDTYTSATLPFAPNALGSYLITLVVTDKDMGASLQASASIEVVDTVPHITTDPSAILADDGLTAALSVRADDDRGPDNLFYHWDLIGGPADVEFSNNDASDADDTVVTFGRVGRYQFAVTVEDADGNATQRRLYVVVAHVATALQVSPWFSTLAPGATQQLTVTGTDQFGDAIDDPQNPTWDGTDIVSGGNVDSTGLYTAGSELGQDVIRVRLGIATGVAGVWVSNVGSGAIAGVGADGGRVVAGDSTGDVWLGAFYDPTPNMTPSDYHASVQWGDGQSDDNLSIQATQVGTQTIFVVYGSHTYATIGTKSFTVTFTPNANSSRAKSVTGTVHVIAAPIRAQMSHIIAPVSNTGDATFTGEVATFVDDNPNDLPSNFGVIVDWGDGDLEPVTPELIDGVFHISGSHPYSPVVPRNVVVTITQDGNVVVRLGSRVDFVDSTAATPTGFRAVGLSSSQIYLDWDKDTSVDGYIIWATNSSTGERHRLPADPTQILGRQDAPPGNPNKYAAWDQQLPQNAEFQYQIQAVYLDGRVSPLSASVTGQTWATVTVAPPSGLTARRAIEGGSAGVQLYWDAGDADGYKVFRKLANGQWQDLQGIDPATGKQNYLPVIVSAMNGKVGYFDAGATFPAGVTSYDYRVVAYKTDTGQAQPVASTPAIVSASQTITTPSVPTGLKAASYPQAIQLSWDDRPTSEDDEFGGWNVYRFDATHGIWQRLNPRPITQETGFNDYTAPVRIVSTYRITAIDLFANESAPTASVSHRRSIHGEPSAPQDLRGWPTAAATITLQWDAVVPVLDFGHLGDQLRGYNVYRKLATGSIWSTTPLNATPITSTTYVDGGLAVSTGYDYRVTAIDQDGDESNPAELSLQSGNNSPPAAPAIVSATADGPNGTRLEWTVGSGDNGRTTLFRVYRSRTLSGNYETVGEFAVSGTSNVLHDTDLASSTPYYYQILAVDADGDIASTSTSASTQSVPDQAPVVMLDGARGSAPKVISDVTEVSGLVDDANNDLKNWELFLVAMSGPNSADALGTLPLLADADGTSAMPDINRFVVARGDQEIGQAPDTTQTLGSIRPTLLPDGIYQLVLVGEDQTGRSSYATGATIQIKTDVKTGNFTLPIEDLSIDVPGGEPITVSRVYDSSQANVDGKDFGPGWRLELSDTQLHTTATAGSRGDASLPALSEGDLIYIDLPGRGQQVFEFTPKPLNYDPTNPATGLGAELTYEPLFVAVDGSQSRLTVPDLPAGSQLVRDGHQFYIVRPDGNGVGGGFNPARKESGGFYELTSEEGMTYRINAATGHLVTSTDTNGNQVRYSDDAAGTGTRNLLIERDTHGRIQSVSDGGSHTVEYEYDQVTGDLISVSDVAGAIRHVTTYTYDPRRPHYLVKVTDPRGIDVIQVAYDDFGKPAAVIDVSGKSAPVGFDTPQKGVGANTATDLSGSSTEEIHNEQGDIIRQIQTVVDAVTGLVKGYVVTVHDYSYLPGDFFDPLEAGFSAENKSTSNTDWQPFTIDGPDLEGRRYSAEPTKLATKTVYKTPSDGTSDTDDPDLFLPQSQAVLAPDGVSLQTTSYSHYVLGKAGWITDPYGSTTKNFYDWDPVAKTGTGNLIATENALHERTDYSYTNGGSYTYSDERHQTVDYTGLPSGLLLETWREGSDGAKVLISKNVYYASEASARNFGRVEFTTDEIKGLTTRYTYWDNGGTKDVFREWTDAAGPHSVADSYTQYDDLGRVNLSRDAQQNETKTYYDAAGHVLATVDPFGGVTINSYDVHGNLVRVLYADHTETRTTYDDSGRVLWSSDRFASNSQATLLILKDPKTGLDTGEATVTWDAQGNDNAATYNLTYATFDSLGRSVGTERFKQARIVITADTNYASAGVFVTASPDHQALLSAGLRTSATSTEYDGIGRTSASVDAGGSRTETTFFDNGSAHTVTGGAGSSVAATATSEHDLWRANRVVIAGDIHDGDTFTLSFRPYPGAARQDVVFIAPDPTTLTDGTSEVNAILAGLREAINSDSRSLVKKYSADIANGELQLTLRPGEANTDYLILASISAGAQTRVSFGASSTSIRSDWMQDANSHVTINIYDELGRISRVISDDGSFTETLYGINNDAATVAADGTMVASPTAAEGWPADGIPLGGRHEVRIRQRNLGPGEAVVAMHYLYDAAGQLTDVWFPAVKDADPSSPTLNQMVRPHWHYIYDANGNEAAQIDPKGRRTEFSYDELNRQLTRTLPIGVATTANQHDFIERVEYDPQFGQPSLLVDFEGRVTQSIYDNTPVGRGRLLTKRFFPNQSDYQNFLTDPVAHPPTQILSYHYDGIGRVNQVVDSLDGTWTYDHDSISGQLSKTVSPQGTIHYEYDPATNRVVRTYTGNDDPAHATVAGDGKAVTDTRYTYDDLGRLKTVGVFERNDAPLPSPETTTYFYDGVGNIDATVQSNGVTSDYIYDHLNRLTELDHFVDGDGDRQYDAGETVVGRFVYDLNTDGTRKKETETDDQGQSRIFNWSYDAMNRLIGETYDGPGSDDDYVTAYSLDLVSNRVQKRTDRAATSSAVNAFLADGTISPDETTTSAFDANDRLLTQVDDDLNDNSKDRNTVFTYGPANTGTEQTGKEVRSGATIGSGTVSEQDAFDYNVQGQLAQATVSKGNITTVSQYAYDPNGMRIEQNVTVAGTTTTTRYVLDTANLTGLPQTLEEKDGAGNVINTYTLGLDVLTQYDAANGALTLLYDGHGSTRALTNTARTVLQRLAYDGYGDSLIGLGLTASGDALTNLLYSGEETDAATGLQYLDARYYDAATGRFDGLDPFAGNTQNPRSLHKYLYAQANPVSFVDPSGKGLLADLLVTMREYLKAFDRLTRPVRKFLGRAFKNKNWDVYASAKWFALGIPPWHMAIYVQNRTGRAGFLYDVMSGSSFYEKLWGIGSAKLIVRPWSAALQAANYRSLWVASFTNNQFAAWTGLSTGLQFYDTEKTVRLVLNSYFGYLAPVIWPWATNCTLWVAERAVLASTIQFLPL